MTVTKMTLDTSAMVAHLRALAVAVAIATLALPAAAHAQANLQGANLEGRDMQHWDLRGANLRGANLKNAKLNYANLEQADLTGANLNGAHLGNAQLSEATLSGVLLEHAHMDHAVLNNATLDGSQLDGTRATHAYARGLQAKGTDFALVDFTSAIFEGGNFGGSNFYGTTLTDAILRKADLRGAAFAHTHFKNTETAGSRINSDATFSDSFQNDKRAKSGLFYHVKFQLNAFKDDGRCTFTWQSGHGSCSAASYNGGSHGFDHNGLRGLGWDWESPRIGCCIPHKVVTIKGNDGVRITGNISSNWGSLVVTRFENLPDGVHPSRNGNPGHAGGAIAINLISRHFYESIFERIGYEMHGEGWLPRDWQNPSNDNG